MHQKIDSVKTLLESLRWKADKLVKNHFEEWVYLKKEYLDTGMGYLTECCSARYPCDRHKVRHFDEIITN